MLGYLPAKFKVRFLPAVPTDDPAFGDEPWEDKALVQTVAHEIRATIQAELADMLGERPQRLVRMSSKRILITGPVDVLGRPARAGARARPGGRGDHRRRSAARRRSSCTAPSTSA
jgi:hypothetical protein